MENDPGFIIVDTTTQDDLHDQYRKKTIGVHPDTGGSDAAFNELTAEYEFYKKNLDVIKEFDEMISHGKESLVKFAGFFVSIASANEYWGLLAGGLSNWLTNQIQGYKLTNLRIKFIQYLKKQAK